MNLFETLVTHLKNEPTYVTIDGELKKWIVIHAARKVDDELIDLLLRNAVLKEEFFKTGKKVVVFDQERFIQFLEQKNYLPDSYTQYKNKIGLAIDGKFMKQRNEVALVWPFKDCVLEGGQSREEDKRDEIFFNEILAQDEITQLLEPKVLTAAKVFDTSGAHAFKKFTRDAALNKKRGLPESTITDNLLIKGNNLLALHSLKKEFAGKVKLIYIDPPYNTGNDSFHYNDRFNHSSWLTFMKNRLEIAKVLLHKAGVIFIHGDDNEQSYLKVLMDDVFKIDNYQATIINNATPNGRDYGFFAQNQEYIHVYSKDFHSAHLNKVAETNTEKYKKEDQVGRYYLHPLFNSNSNFHKGNRPNLYYPFYISPHINNEGYYELSLTKKKGAVEMYPPKSQKDGTQFVWRWGKEKAEQNLNAEIVGQKMNNGLFRVAQKMRLDEKIPRTIWSDPSLSNRRGTEELQELFKGKVFAYPKAEALLKEIIAIGSNEGDIVLDYHLGSGTTASVAHKMNRQFIGIEQMDYVENITIERLKKVIGTQIKEGNKLFDELEYDSGGISKAVDWKGGGAFTYIELKKYNQTFIEQIEAAKDSKVLLRVWENMKVHSFLNYNVDMKAQDEHLANFKKLTLKEQKQHLCEILDKNQLHVNLTSIDDTDFACTDAEKKVTRDFYQQ